MLRLSAVIGDYPQTRALHAGAVDHPRLALELTDLAARPGAFRLMLEQEAFDICEMPIVTFLQAHAAGRPVSLLPVVTAARDQHARIVCNSARGALTPTELAGRRVGVRSWTRTTGVWVRGILAQDYGVDLDAVRWLTVSESHLPPLVEPAERVRGELIAMLLEGAIDAVIGESASDPRVQPLIPDAAAAVAEWRRRYGVVAVNHMLVARAGLLRSEPWLTGALCELFARSRTAAGMPEGDLTAVDERTLKASLAMIVAFATAQRIIPEALAIDGLLAAPSPR
jgi:4,5-dihydroxyphthalate decarboxylase